MISMDHADDARRLWISLYSYTRDRAGASFLHASNCWIGIWRKTRHGAALPLFTVSNLTRPCRPLITARDLMKTTLSDKQIKISWYVLLSHRQCPPESWGLNEAECSLSRHKYVCYQSVSYYFKQAGTTHKIIHSGRTMIMKTVEYIVQVVLG